MFIIISFVNGHIREKHLLSQAVYIQVRYKKNLAARGCKVFQISSLSVISFQKCRHSEFWPFLPYDHRNRSAMY